MTVRGLTVATRCASVEEFIDHYSARSDTTSILIDRARIDPRLSSVDHECAFAFLLANDQPVFAGTCFARSHSDRCLRLHIVRLGPYSERVFAALDYLRRLRVLER